jgi:hypothetical protein
MGVVGQAGDSERSKAHVIFFSVYIGEGESIEPRITNSIPKEIESMIDEIKDTTWERSGKNAALFLADLGADARLARTMALRLHKLLVRLEHDETLSPSVRELIGEAARGLRAPIYKAGEDRKEMRPRRRR